MRDDEETEISWSEVVKQYQRRPDLILNPVETVAGYAREEGQTLTTVVEARPAGRRAARATQFASK